MPFINSKWLNELVSIHFDGQTAQSLASEIPLKLTPVSFWYEPIAFVSFLAFWHDILYHSSFRLQINHLSKKDSWFLLSKDGT